MRRILQLRDATTGKPVSGHDGSVHWNAYRRRWVMIICEAGGTSFLGETWYAEADTPLGPWVYARKVVTHNKYSFYNPKQHPMFDQDGGRLIYFEGTYTHTFSGNDDATPRYDYNQIMYRLDLADPRLNLPVADLPPGRRRPGPGALDWARTTRAFGSPSSRSIARRREACRSSRRGPRTADRVLDVGRPSRPPGPGEPIFHALPADAEDPPATTVPLYAIQRADGTVIGYATEDDPEPDPPAPPLGTADLPGLEEPASRGAAARVRSRRVRGIRRVPPSPRLVNLPDEDQAIDDLTDAERVLLAVGDAEMMRSGGVKSKEISVLSEDNPILSEGIDDVFLIAGVQELSLGRRRYVDALTPQAFGDRSIAILIQMEANRPGHSVAVLSRRWTAGPPGASRRTRLPRGCRSRSRRDGRSSRREPREPGRV